MTTGKLPFNSFMKFFEVYLNITPFFFFCAAHVSFHGEYYLIGFNVPSRQTLLLSRFNGSLGDFSNLVSAYFCNFFKANIKQTDGSIWEYPLCHYF